MRSIRPDAAVFLRFLGLSRALSRVVRRSRISIVKEGFMRLVSPAVLLAAALFTSPAFAQSGDSFDTLNFKELPTVYVTDLNSQETAGRLLGMDAFSISLIVGGSVRTFQASQLKKVEKKGDSLLNGAVYGALVGLINAIVATSEPCPGGRSPCTAARTMMVVGSIGIFAAVGTAIDAAIPGRTLLWKAPTISW